MKKALITGVTGMVGSHMCDFLLKETDWKIFGLCRWRSNPENVSHLINKDKNKINFLYGDLNDFSSLFKILKELRPDYIFHLAAQSFPKTSFDSPLETLYTNIIGTANLLESLKILDLKKTWVQICSSSEVFGEFKKICYQSMKSVIFTLHRHMLFPRLVPILLVGSMQRHIT